MTEATIQEQAGKLLPQAAGYVGARTIEIGLELGLIHALAESTDGLTADDLAKQADGDPFYAGVWCRAAYGAEVVEHDEATRTYRLAPHMKTLLLDRSSPAYVGGLFGVITQPELFDSFAANFRSGKRIWWDQVSPEFIEGVAGTGGAFNNRLIPGALGKLPGVADALNGDARVLELGCGTGYGIVRLLQHHPGATVVGVDGDAYSLEVAAKAIAEAGYGERVELVESTLEDLDRENEFDLVTINVSMHECRDIDKVAANAHRALKPGGTFVISDFPFPGTHEGLRAVPARIMSGIQYFEALIGDQLLPTATYVELLERHGFSDVASFDVTPVHAVTHGRR